MAGNDKWVTVEEMNTILCEELLSKEPTLKGPKYDPVRAGIKKDVEKAEKEGIVLETVRE
jgi:hypothetical protein